MYVCMCTYAHIPMQTSTLGYPTQYPKGHHRVLAIVVGMRLRVPQNRPEIKSLLGATGSPLPYRHYYHVL